MQDSAAAFQGMKQHQPFPEQEPHLKCPRCDSTNTKFCYYNNYNLSQPRHFCKNCRRYWTKGGALRNIPVGGGTRKSSKRSNSSSSAGGSSSSATDADATPASTSNNINPPKRANSSNNSIPAAPSPNPVASTSAATSAFGLQLPRTEHFAPIFLAAPPSDQERQMLDLGGSFSSLLAASGHYGGLLESFHPTGTSILRLPNSGGLVGGTMTGSGVDLAGGAGDRGGDGENPHPTPAQGAAEDFMGLRGDPGYWNDNGGGRGGGGGGGGGWPGLSMYTPGSTFRQ